MHSSLYPLATYVILTCNRSNLTGLVLVNCGDADEVPSSVNDERVVNLGQCVGMVFG